MRKKIVGVLICALLLSTLLPVTGIENAHKDKTESAGYTLLDSMAIAHVVAKGTGSCISVRGSFIFGFGACWAMIVTLEDDGYIEISSLISPSDSITLEGCHRIYIIGFMGLRWNIPTINVNGLSLFTLWS